MSNCAESIQTRNTICHFFLKNKKAPVPLSSCISALHLVKRSSALKTQIIMLHSRKATWELLILSWLVGESKTFPNTNYTSRTNPRPRTQEGREGGREGGHFCRTTSDIRGAKNTNKEGLENKDTGE